MAEPVAEHERSDLQLLGVCGQPGGRHHRFEHRLVVGQRWHQVIHAGDPDEARRFGGAARAIKSWNDNRIWGRNRLNSIGPQPSANI